MDYHAIANCLEQDFYGQRRAFRDPSDTNFQDWAKKCLKTPREINLSTLWLELQRLQRFANIPDIINANAFCDYEIQCKSSSALKVHTLLKFISEAKKVFTIEEFL